LKSVGLILLCLLFYLPNETLAYYGGQCVHKDSDETLLYPFHNLPIGLGQEMLGGVTKHFALEDFIDFPAVGSFLKSSRCDPYIDEAGSLYRPDRLKNLNVQPGIMSTIGMKTRLVQSGGAVFACTVCSYEFVNPIYCIPEWGRCVCMHRVFV
jgi:hypothetical protein